MSRTSRLREFVPQRGNREVNIRIAVKNDFRLLIELDHIAKADREGRREFIADGIERGECHIACIEDQVIGYIVLNDTFYGHGRIEMLYLKEEYRDQGIGGSLIDHVEELCEKEKLFTSTNLSNLRMQGLLEKKQFIVSGIIHNLDEDDPEIVYFKRVSNNSK